ncbi:hypothetical protein GWI33_012186 [Rhynchophorus ferrugineus]|uniref:Uncharacterized protein n=1 Tax=Rhynchophorus ferrugineus TaxID=354439 RepID=A0A834M8Z2_RHYFE|nr:hypothetical protein GWI33_012186 [Rhynchophorus ferrugineus]
MSNYLGQTKDLLKRDRMPSMSSFHQFYKSEPPNGFCEHFYQKNTPTETILKTPMIRGDNKPSWQAFKRNEKLNKNRGDQFDGIDATQCV